MGRAAFIKTQKLSCFLFFVLVGCTSSGVEPQWDQDGNSQESSPSPGGAAGYRNFRVELRDSTLEQSQDRQWRAQLNPLPTIGSSGKSTRRITNSTPFVVGVPGQDMFINHRGRLYKIRLDKIRRDKTRSGDVRNASVELSLQVLTGATQGNQNSYLSRQLGTRMVAPLGKWIVVGGIDSAENDGGRQSSLGPGVEMRRGVRDSQSQSSVELRVSGFGGS